MQSAIVLGVHSFLDKGIKVGTQYIAEGLVENGWKVDYLSVPSSLFDLYGRERRKRLQRVWVHHQDARGIVVKPNLTEYAFRSPHPAHKIFLRSHKMLDRYSRMAPAWVRTCRYDVCIHDITVNILFLPLIQADLLVLRLNDPPEGFGFHIHQVLIDRFKDSISLPAYDEIWAVSEPLAKYALNLNPANNVAVLPNGIEGCFPSFPCNGERPIKKAIYIGSVSPWVDLELLDQTALLLPDWQFHIFGQCNRSWRARSRNIKKFAPVPRELVPSLLSDYQVGLIPFREISGRMNYVERPLKFYEYIAAGLGIASTDIGGLKNGMGDLAAFGNTPRGFAMAITQAAMDGTKRTDAFNRAFIAKHAWQNIIQRMCQRIDILQNRL